VVVEGLSLSKVGVTGRGLNFLLPKSGRRASKFDDCWGDVVPRQRIRPVRTVGRHELVHIGRRGIVGISIALPEPRASSIAGGRLFGGPSVSQIRIDMKSGALLGFPEESPTAIGQK